MEVRQGFRRFAVSIQYHGSPFLGFSSQKHQEDCVLPDGTDLRGYSSVETRLRNAMTSLLQTEANYENLQVSSRTDRGVHAIKNTLHVDLEESVAIRSTDAIRRGINFYLSRQPWISASDDTASDLKRLRNATQYKAGGEWSRQNPACDVKVLTVKEAPANMANPNGALFGQPDVIGWNARFSAIQRTYAYRVLHVVNNQDWMVPFEWDRSWRVNDTKPLDLAAMIETADSLKGTHDFSSFRASQCQQKSPIMTLNKVHVQSEQYKSPFSFGDDVKVSSQLVTILFKGNSFLYHQVRNMVGFLVHVGKGKMDGTAGVPDLLNAKDRRKAPRMAPAHGLYLVDVEHEGIVL